MRDVGCIVKIAIMVVSPVLSQSFLRSSAYCYVQEASSLHGVCYGMFSGHQHTYSSFEYVPWAPTLKSYNHYKMSHPAVTFWKVDHLQRQFSFNLLAGILGDCFAGPHILPTRVSGRDCLNFLPTRLSGLLEGVSFSTHLYMCFQHDAAPLHCIRKMHQWLFENYPGRWIGRGR
jgi:hypothetical protein